MKRNLSSVITFALVLLLAGCGPASSLFPLFITGDKEFDERLLGEWRIQGDSTFKPGVESGRIVFRKSAEGTDYEVTIFDFDGKGMNVALTGRMVRLGNFSFIDFGTADADKREFSEIPFPALESHFFGRIHMEKGGVRIDFLNEDWVKEKAKAGKLTLATVQTPNGLVISATTEELRKFALEHADDTDAFSEPYSLSRTK